MEHAAWYCGAKTQSKSACDFSFMMREASQSVNAAARGSAGEFSVIHYADCGTVFSFGRILLNTEALLIHAVAAQHLG